MNQAVENLMEAQKFAMKIRPNVGGFPYLAEALRQAGVVKNIWSLPACQSVYITRLGDVVQQGTPLVTGSHAIAKFDQDALVRALRKDQRGEGSFPEFLQSAWEAGVIGYEVDFTNRKVTYYGTKGGSYIEDYPAVELKS